MPQREDAHARRSVSETTAASAHAAALTRCAVFCRQRHDGHVTTRLLLTLPDGCGRGEAIHLRHLDVHENEVHRLALENSKYGTDYTMELMDPDVNACFRIEPISAFGLTEDDFTGSPTRWTFSPATS